MRVQPHGFAVDCDDVAKIKVVGQIAVVEMIGQYASLFPDPAVTRRREGSGGMTPARGPPWNPQPGLE